MKKKIIIGIIFALVTVSIGTTGVLLYYKNNNTNEVKETNKDKLIKDDKEKTDASILEEEPTTTETEPIENNTDVPVKSETKETNKNSTTNKKSDTTNTTTSESKPAKDNTNHTVSNNDKTKEELKIISSKNVDETNTETKYGVKITTTTTYKIDTYSDGNINKTKLNSKTSYDKSGYSATTSELKSEAATLANKNRAIYNEVLSYVNSYRSEAGVGSLVLDTNLSVAATVRALELGYSGDVMDISHTRPNGTSCVTVLDEMSISYYAWGENIAAGYRTAAAVSDGWRNSPGHYQNMITDYYGKLGVGMVEVDGYRYWVQLFTN